MVQRPSAARGNGYLIFWGGLNGSRGCCSVRLMVAAVIKRPRILFWEVGQIGTRKRHRV